VQTANYSSANQTALLLLIISFLVLSVVYGVNRRAWAVGPWRKSKTRLFSRHKLRRQFRPIPSLPISKSESANVFQSEGTFNLNVHFRALAVHDSLWRVSAGKTTLLDCIAGLSDPDEGALWLAVKTFTTRRRRGNLAAWKRRIGYVHQDLASPSPDREENVAYGLRARSSSTAAGAPATPQGAVEMLGASRNIDARRAGISTTPASRRSAV